jgi:hypothetical protein
MNFDKYTNPLSKWVARDKQLHFFGGVIIAAALAVAGYGIFAALATTVVGIGKEVYDKRTPGNTADALDAVYTAAPGWLVSAIYAYFIFGGI